MGGGLALAVAADFPTLVGKIVIVDAFALFDGFDPQTLTP